MAAARVTTATRLAVILALPRAIGRVAWTVVSGALAWVALRGIALGWIAPVAVPTAFAAALCRIARTGAVITLCISMRFTTGRRTRLMLALALLLLAGRCRRLLAS
jgi:hypothetical protein